MTPDDPQVPRSDAAAASRRWAGRLWAAQLGVIVVGVVLLATTEAGLLVVAASVAALLAVHLWARRSLGRELAELGRPDAGRERP